VASVVWHVPQYVLATGALVDLGRTAGAELPPLGTSLFVLVLAVAMTSCYGRSVRLVRAYESALKYLVWAIVLSLLWVVLRTDTDWGRVLWGFVPHLPQQRHAESPVTLVVSGLGAAVGINMVFLYPYSLLARGWGRAHRNLARCDLLLGMWLPYTLATSLMVIAAANTLFASGEPVGRGATIHQVGAVLGQVLGPVLGRVVFDLGMFAMAFSTISLHMVVCGFVASAWFGCAVGSCAHRLWSLLPAPACLAPALLPLLGYQNLPPWIGVPTNVLCLGLLPLCYVGFLLLQQSRAYLGADRPRGTRLALWLTAMGLAIATIVVGFAAGLRDLLR
ncbi:MAG: divalent metal cation transporter, partial [Planctomycetes bacterium]|nr:divalent metal cation transporter [Planctomycetota bacterium]